MSYVGLNRTRESHPILENIEIKMVKSVDQNGIKT